MTRGGPRPNAGGRRPGAGRPALPRLTGEEVRAAVRELVGGDDHAARARLAGALGISAVGVRTACRAGATVSQVEAWRERMAAIELRDVALSLPLTAAELVRMMRAAGDRPVEEWARETLLAAAPSVAEDPAAIRAALERYRSA